MSLYTFIANYDGGTYISQVTAPDPKSAVFAWAQALEVAAIPGFGDKSKQDLLCELHQDEEDEILYTPLDGLAKVWCVTPVVRGKLMLVNFVETSTNT